MTPRLDPVEAIKNRIHNVKKHGNGWQGTCPCHDDRTASLSIDRGDDGRALLKCHAGCKSVDILAAIGLSWADAFAQSRAKEPTPITKKRGRFVEAYDYVNADGKLIYQSVRFAEPKDFSQRRPDGNGEWVWNLKGIPELYLYHLPEVLAADPATWLFIVEGEKDADRLRKLGRIATTNGMGAEKWRPEYSEQLRGKSIVVIGDNDEAGRNHVDLVAKSTQGFVRRARIVALPDLLEKGDVSDWLDANNTLEELDRIIASLPDWKHGTGETTNTDDSSDEPVRKGERKSQATVLFELMQASNVEFWHTPSGDEYVSITVDGHIEHHPIRSKGFRDLASKIFYDVCRSVPGSQATQDAINGLCGVARYDGDERQVFTRIAWVDSVLWNDLGSPDRSVSRIDATGWSVVPSHEVPVKFRRSRNTGVLPIPVRGGSLNDLWALFRIDDDSGKLVPAWLHGCLQPHGARAHLELTGQQGSGKTTLLRMLIALIDPAAEVDVRSMPKDEDALVIAVMNRAILGFDNISHLPPDQADAFSRVSTGGGIGKRMHYSNDEEITIRAQLPLAWTGINSVIPTYQDLQDRTISVSMKPLDPSTYESEFHLWQRFRDMQAGLLGALYDIVSTAIRRLDEVDLERKPRLADFAEWVEAAAPAFGWEPDEFVDAYAESRAHADENAVETSPIGELIVSLMQSVEKWEGSAADLLAELRGRADDERRKLRGFPKQPNQLSNQLKRLRPSLRGIGVWIDFERSTVGRKIVIARDEQTFGKEHEAPARTRDRFEQASMPDDNFEHLDPSATCCHPGCSCPVAPGGIYFCDLHSEEDAA